MSTIVTRSGKGSPLTHNEVDTNFTNLNTDKVEKTAADITGGTINNTTIGATTPSTGVFTTLTAQNETLKGTGQNLITYSQDFSNAAWTKLNSTVSGTLFTAPDGTTTANKLQVNTTNGQHLVYRFYSSSTNITFTESVYLKAGEITWAAITDVQANGFYINLSTGALGSNIGLPVNATITSVGSGWYRVSFTFTNSLVNQGVAINAASGNGTASFAGANTTDGLYIWGAQLEIGSTANTYIPTTTTAVYGTPTLSFSGVASIGLQSDGSLYETSAGTGNVRFYTNNIAQEQMRVSHTASAVNYVQVTGAATNVAPAITAQGSDSFIGLSLQAKSATLSLGTRVGGSATLQIVDNGASPINFFRIVGAATTVAPVLSAQGSDTNIPLVLQPKGTGALQAQQTDSTATGGNARGANAVDWQTLRNSASEVASGAYSIVGGGQRNTANGAYAQSLGGYSNSSSGFESVLVGGQSNGASGQISFIGGGTSNITSGYGSTIVGGTSNTSAGVYGFIGAGQLNSGTSGSVVTTQSGTMNATTAVTLSGSNANIKVGQYISGTSIATDTYVAAISGTSLTLSKVASGSSTSTLSFFTPHGVVVGGGNNQATGSYSYIGGGGDAGTAANRNVASGDWSFVGGGMRNTASGLGSVVVGGGDGTNTYANTASGTGAFIGAGINNTSTNNYTAVVNGALNTASAQYAFVGGGYSNGATGQFSTVAGGSFGTARGITGNAVSSACFIPITGASGASQSALLILGRQTTDATATVLASNSNAASTTNQVILPNNSAYAFRGTVIANVTGGGNTKAWSIEGAIKRGANAASTALVGTPTVTSGYADAGASTWAITATADTTNGGLAITFTGQAGTTIRVVCKVETTEVTF